MSYERRGLQGAAEFAAQQAAEVHVQAAEAAKYALSTNLLSPASQVQATILDVAKPTFATAASAVTGVALTGSLQTAISMVATEVVIFALSYVVPAVTAMFGAAAGAAVAGFVGKAATVASVAIAEVSGALGTVAWPLLAVAVVALIVAGVLSVCANDAEEEAKRWATRCQATYREPRRLGPNGTVRPCDVLIDSVDPTTNKFVYSNRGIMFAAVESVPKIPAATREAMRRLRMAIESCSETKDGGLIYWPVYLDLIASQFRSGTIVFADVLLAYLHYTRPGKATNEVMAWSISRLYDAQVDIASGDAQRVAHGLNQQSLLTRGLFDAIGPEMELCSGTPIWGGDCLAVEQRDVFSFVQILKNWNEFAAKQSVKVDLAVVRKTAEKALKIIDIHKLTAKALLAPAVVRLPKSAAKGVATQVAPKPKPAPIVREVAPAKPANGGTALAVGLCATAAALGGLLYWRKHPELKAKIRSRLGRSS